jgi:hypothetical protein
MSLCTLNDVCKKRVAVTIRALTSTLKTMNSEKRKSLKSFAAKKTEDKTLKQKKVKVHSIDWMKESKTKVE